MSTVSLNTDSVNQRFSYYKLEEKSDLLTCAKRVVYAVANMFIYIGNFFYECFFSNKEVERAPMASPEQESEPPKKSNKKVRFAELLDPDISKPKTYEKRNKQGKVITVCDQGTYLPCVSENPLKSSMRALKGEGADLESAIEEYSQHVDSILPSDLAGSNTSFSSQDVSLLKNYRLSKRIETYVKKFEVRNKRKPTQEEFNGVFTEERIKQIHASTERLLKEEPRVEGFKQLLETLKAPKVSPLRKTMIVALGLVAGAAAGYYGSQLGNYLGDLGSHLLLSMKEYNQNVIIASLGTCALTALHGAAFLRRGYNWGKMALAGSVIAAKALVPSSEDSLFSLKTAGKIGAALTGSYAIIPMLYNGMKEYYSNQEFAIGNESKYFIRDYLGVSLMDKFKDHSLDSLSPKIKRGTAEIDSSSRRGFEKSYQIGKQSAITYLFTTTVFGLGAMTAAPLALLAGFAASKM